MYLYLWDWKKKLVAILSLKCSKIFLKESINIQAAFIFVFGIHLNFGIVHLREYCTFMRVKMAD